MLDFSRFVSRFFIKLVTKTDSSLLFSTYVLGVLVSFPYNFSFTTTLDDHQIVLRCL